MPSVCLADVQGLYPALDTGPLKTSSQLQWIFTAMISACLEFIVSNRNLLFLEVIVQSSNLSEYNLTKTGEHKIRNNRTVKIQVTNS